MKKSNNSINSSVSKHDLISELIIKITSTPENIDYLNKKFGNDFMNKIFNPETEETYLRALEKALEEKNASQRTGNFAASFGKKEETDSNRFRNQSNQYKKISKNNTFNNNNSSDDNSSPEKNSDFIYTNGSSNLKKAITTIKSEISNNSSFNKYKNNNNSINNNSRIKNNIKKSVYLNPFEDKSRENQNLNKSVNNLLPGKNYARNILCKAMGERFKTPIGNVFERNLRFYGSDAQNDDVNRSYAKSSDKKYFKNYFSKNSKTFDEHLKTNKIQILNKNTNKKSKFKDSEFAQKEYSFKDSNSHDISFSNKNNNLNQLNSANKFESENIPNNNIRSDRCNYNENRIIYNKNKAHNEKYLSENKNSNQDDKRKNNIIINEDYNYPYSAGNEKEKENENEDHDNLNEQIDEFINENFNEKRLEKKNEEDNFGYLGTHNSQKELRSEKDKKTYNFESDRASLNKNNAENEENIDDLDMEAIKDTIYNNLSDRDII